eukprot:COSAG02_NODE_70529_length_195_cov_41.291667_1_plen_28_part_10
MGLPEGTGRALGEVSRWLRALADTYQYL